MLLGIIGTKGVSDKDIDEVRGIISRQFDITQYYYDTFHNDRFMIADCDIIGLFYNSENEELVREAISTGKPLFIVLKKGSGNERTVERNDIRPDEKTVKRFFGNLKKRKGDRG